MNSSQATGKVPSKDPKSTGGVLGNLMEDKTSAVKDMEGAWTRAGAGNHGTAGPSLKCHPLETVAFFYMTRNVLSDQYLL